MAARAAARVVGMGDKTPTRRREAFVSSFQRKAERAWESGCVSNPAEVVRLGDLAERLVQMHAVGGIGARLLLPRLAEIDIATVHAYMGETNG